ncbi:proto-oncogene tyrosine-protein kinase ROS-like [Camponotus floridanus]|uniref:proto-oncogene tyrosine-protein kinase ROS-like n=1 Tax=Camponotus floridanus TaxID=104421 RepID=UPI000DC6ACD3|nr:proto-oncogene tyrosine-protein kinase ROS-like [Camponotus floridanus]
MTITSEQEVDEVPLANISITPEPIKSSLSKPTSLKAFVQFDDEFTKNDIFVTLRWNQPEFTDEPIQGYTVKCFIENLQEIQIYDDKNITTTKLEYTVNNLKPNTTYYFRICAHTKVVAGPYAEIRVSTIRENPIPKLLIYTVDGFEIWDQDSNITKFVSMEYGFTYSIQEQRIYWYNDKHDLMTMKINENNITKMASYDKDLYGLCIDWVARNLYFMSDYQKSRYIVKFDLTMWENGIIKFDEIIEINAYYAKIRMLPSMGLLYAVSPNSFNNQYDMMKYHLDGKNKQIVQINSSIMYFCPFQLTELRSLTEYYLQYTIIDDMNNEEPLIYWLTNHHVIVTDINVSMCNTILHNKNINNTSDGIIFKSITIDKTYVYILAMDYNGYYLYILEKRYASLKSVNANKYVEKIIIDRKEDYQTLYQIHAFDKSSQPYPPIRCLTPDEKVYNFENVTAMTNSIIVSLPEPVVKSECKKYNLPTTIYTISVSCLDNNLNKSEKFNVLTCERYYEIQNLIPFTEYKLKFTLSNFYFDQLSINPFDSNVISIKTNSGKLHAPENVSVLALTPTIAVVHWIPLKKVNCITVTYEVHWKSDILLNSMQQNNKQLINVPKRMADGRFFTKINLSVSVQGYLIHVRVYPTNFSDFYNESLGKIVHIYSEPNIIILSDVNTNSMNISWISNINLTISSALEYKDVSTEKWQTTNDTRTNYNKEVIYHIKNLQSGTSYQFRLILRYLEYEENFTWPPDERFIFSTRGSKRDISNTPGITKTKYYLPLMLSCIITVIYIICICLYHRRRNNNKQLLPSTMTDMELEILHELPCQNTQLNMLYSPMLHYNPNEYAITKIERKQITLTKPLGSGAFGKVFQGNVKNLERSGTEISVAVKTLQDDASSNEKKKFLKEAKLMSHIQHTHILRLLAICEDGDSPLLVLELMETDLLKYLRDCRNLQPSDLHALRLQDLLAMCEDVARGCCYLEKLRFVHRDLACRNCLVSSRNRENRVIKIGDFGLARDIYKDDYYRVKGENLLPVRWMAPESLIIGIFSSQSDVWSFGILMWEITSLGEQPYIGKSNEEVINYVRAGGKLSINLNCPSILYQLMLRCWSTADARPNFKLCLKNIIELRKNIEDALLSPVDTI